MRFCLLLYTVLFMAGIHAEEVPMSKKLISEFGKYEGYSEPVYDEWLRTSRYLEMTDGVKLAVDIIRPAERGEPVEKPLPVVWNYYRYHRARKKDGKILSMVDRISSLPTLIRHGYVIVVVDASGAGASYGSEDKGPNSEKVAWYIHDVTEWIAGQSWCDGSVGMFGHSYSANIQFLAAGLAPPHLKAIFPCMVSFDTYRIFYRGGVFYDRGAQGIGQSLHYWDIEAPAVPVDGDSTGEMLREAKEQHKKNVEPHKFLKNYTYRNTQKDNLTFWLENNPFVYLSGVNKSGIPVYQWAGWHDFLVCEAFLWFANVKNPQKLTVGPWSHGSHDWHDLLSVEQLRWFDYWLKGIDNGVMDEKAIHYVIIEKPDVFTWHTADSWPPPESKQISCYFNEGPSGSINSVNDGLLSREKPAGKNKNDKYRVDYSTSSEEEDMSKNDAKGLTYTTPPLDSDVTIVGHPVVTLHIKSSAEDVDFYAYLEEVDENGFSKYITLGILRASHRAETEPDFNNLGLPYHRHFKEDIKPIPAGKPVSLSFDFLPISRIVKEGKRIRVTITCADKSYTEEGRVDSPPTITLYRNAQYPSRINLPVVE